VVNSHEGVDTGRSIRRRIQLPGVLVATAALVAYASGSQVAAAAPEAAGPRVEIKHHQYVPATLTVPVGTTVTWINRDDDVHTVISTAEKFRSRGMDTDERFSQTFTAPGTYEYFCTLHPLMKAKVIVK
jgi:plastocyanin